MKRKFIIQTIGKSSKLNAFCSLLIKKSLEEDGFVNVNYQSLEGDWNHLSSLKFKFNSPIVFKGPEITKIPNGMIEDQIIEIWPYMYTVYKKALEERGIPVADIHADSYQIEQSALNDLKKNIIIEICDALI